MADEPGTDSQIDTGTNEQTGSAVQGAQSTETDSPQQQQQQETPEEALQRVTQELNAARAEAGKQRVNAKQKAAEDRENEVVNKLLNALGRKPDGSKKVTTDELTSEIEAERQHTSALAAENTVLRVASQAGADPDRLLNWQPFTSELKELDSSDEKYSESVQALIKKYTGANPFLSARVAVKTGTKMGSGTASQVTKEQFDKMDGAQLAALAVANPTLYAQLDAS